MMNPRKQIVLFALLPCVLALLAWTTAYLTAPAGSEGPLAQIFTRGERPGETYIRPAMTDSAVTVGTSREIPRQESPADVFIRTRGYRTVGDGGDAEYLVIDDTTGLGLGTNAGLIPMNNGKFALLQTDNCCEVNVRWFGARGDSTSIDRDAFNDAAAFLHAINRGGKICVPPGRYNMGIDFERAFFLESNITVEGTSPAACVLLRPFSNNSTEVVGIVKKHDVELRNLTIINYTVLPFAKIVYGETVRGLVIDNCRLICGGRPSWGWMPQTYINGVENLTVRNSYIKWSQIKAGGAIGGARNVRIENCYFDEPTNFAFSAVNNEQVNFNYSELYFVNNIVNGVRGQGALFFGRDGEGNGPADTLRNVFVTGNSFFNVDSRFQTSVNVIYILQNRTNENIIISGNTIKSSEDQPATEALGICFRPGSIGGTFTHNLVIANNTISGVGMPGILASVRGNALIENNTLDNGRGIYVEALDRSDVLVTSNIIDRGEINILADEASASRVDVTGNHVVTQENFKPVIRVSCPDDAASLHLRVENNRLINTSNEPIRFEAFTGRLSAWISGNLTNAANGSFVANAPAGTVIGHNHYDNRYQAPPADPPGAGSVTFGDAFSPIAGQVYTNANGALLNRSYQERTVTLSTNAQGYATVAFNPPLPVPPATVLIEEIISNAQDYYDVVLRDATTSNVSFGVIVYDGSGRPLAQRSGIRFRYVARQ